MNDRRAFCVGAGAERRNQRRDASSDIRSDNYVVDRVPAVPDGKTCKRHFEYDRRDGGRRLHERGNRNADKEQEQRIGNFRKQTLDGIEYFGILLPIERAGHKFEPHENQSQRRKRKADRLDFIRLGKHRHEDADRRKTEEEHRKIEITERKHPGGERRSDIRAHDDRSRLKQRHDPGIDESDDHDRRKRRTLPDDRDHRADPDAGKPVVGSLVEQTL